VQQLTLLLAEARVCCRETPGPRTFVDLKSQLSPTDFPHHPTRDLDTLRPFLTNFPSLKHHQSNFLISSQCSCQWPTAASPIPPAQKPCHLALSLPLLSSLLLLFHPLVRSRASSHFSLYPLTHRQTTAPSRTSSRPRLRLLCRSLLPACPLVKTDATMHFLQRLLMHHKSPAPVETQTYLPSKMSPFRVLPPRGQLLVRTVASPRFPFHSLTYC
jgi:hypothetical protein